MDVSPVKMDNRRAGKYCHKMTLHRKAELIRLGQGVRNGILPSGESLLNSLCQNGLSTTVIELIQEGADVHIRGLENTTALHSILGCEKIVEKSTREEVVSVLLKKGAKVNTADCRGQTPLHEAAQLGNVEIVKMLLQEGARINTKFINMKRKTPAPPLLWAIKHGRREVVSILLEHGADVNATSSVNGWSALCEAIMQDASMAFNLLDRGANIFSVNGDVTAFELALLRHNCILLDKMLTLAFNSGQLKTSIGLSKIVKRTVLSGCTRCMNQILHRGVSVNEYLGKGYDYPIFIAILTDSRCNLTVQHMPMVEFLVDSGAILDNLWEQVIWSISSLSFSSEQEPTFWLCIRAFNFQGCDGIRLESFFRKVGLMRGRLFNRLLALLYMAGYTPSEETTMILVNSNANLHNGRLRTEFREPDKLPCLCHRDAEELPTWLSHTRAHPRSLSNICAVAIRQSLRDNVICSARSLPVPETLKEFITLDRYW